MTTPEQVYDRTIKPLSAGERLRLARMILNDLPDEALVDYNDDWSEDDLRDATRYSLQRAAVLMEGEAEDAQTR